MESNPANQPRLKVLVADDEQVIADTLKTILNQEGFDVAIAYNGAAAVEAARQWIPDIFLSDVVMPEMNGIEAAICIRAIHPRCKVLLFSGQAVTSNLMQDAWLRGYGFEVLVKPVHPLELIARLRNPGAGMIDPETRPKHPPSEF